jgi:hypothetical protein
MTDNTIVKRTMTLNDLQNTTQKIKIDQYEPLKNPGVKLDALEG